MGLSKSKTKTQSTTNSSSTPLDQYAPYITQGLTSAKGIMDANQGNMEMLGGKALDVANGFSAPNAALGQIYTGQNPAQATYNRLQGAGANDPSMGLLQQQANAGTGAYDSIGTGNPALATMQGMTTQNNPAIGLLRQMAGSGSNGDTSGYYKDVIGGKFLQNNPYIDNIAQQATDAATKAQNSRFAMSGMDAGMSTPYSTALGQAVSDANNQVRYKNYSDERQLQQQAAGMSDSEYNTTQGRNLQAAQGLGSVYGADADRALQAAQGLGSLYNQTGQLRLGAQQAGDAHQLAAAQGLGAQYNADNATSLAGANGSISSIMQALGLVPGMAGAQIGALGAAAQLPYTGLQSYAGLVNGLTAKYGNQSGTASGTSTTNGSMIDGIAKLGQAAGTAAMAFSDIRLKRDVERIGELSDGLGVYRYRYIWDDDHRVGVMAHEVAAHRPWALGPVVEGYSTVNYGAL